MSLFALPIALLLLSFAMWWRAILRRLAHLAALVPLLVQLFVVEPRMGLQDNLLWKAARSKKRLLECLCWRPDRFFDRLISTLAAWPGIVLFGYQMLVMLGTVQVARLSSSQAAGPVQREHLLGVERFHLPIG